MTPNYPEMPNWTPDSFPRGVNVCLVTPDFPGASTNGGVGRAVLELALLLVRNNFNVTVVFVREVFEKGNANHWQKEYSKHGFRFEHLCLGSDSGSRYTGWYERSYIVYRWLVQRSFDIVHFQDVFGLGYCTLSARRLGIEFTRTWIDVTVHGPERYSRWGNGYEFNTTEVVALDALERESAKLADAVICPSRFLLAWMNEQGWDFPESTWVMPNPKLSNSSNVQRLNQTGLACCELVFFGRLEIRKGLDIFCDAIDALQGTIHVSLSITFLGKNQHLGKYHCNSDEYVMARASNWKNACSILCGLSSEEALGYLATPGKVAVMPSIMENTPYTVVECLNLGIPFIASDVGGIPELVRHDERTRVLFKPDTGSLVSRITEIVALPTFRVQPGQDYEAIARKWIAYHNHVAGIECTSGSDDHPPTMNDLFFENPQSKTIDPEDDSIIDDQFDLGVQWPDNGKARAMLLVHSDVAYLSGAQHRITSVLNRSRSDIVVFSGMLLENLDAEPEDGCIVPRVFDTLKLLDGSEVLRGVVAVSRHALETLRTFFLPEQCHTQTELVLASMFLDLSTTVDPSVIFRAGWHTESLSFEHHHRLAAIASNNVARELWDLPRYFAFSGGAEPGYLPRKVDRETVAKSHTGQIFSSEYPIRLLTSSSGFGHGDCIVRGDRVICIEGSHSAGHCVFGPDHHVFEDFTLKVRYQIDFVHIVQVAEPTVSLDIYDSRHDRILVHKTVVVSPYEAGRQVYTLQAGVFRGQCLEFRVYWHGRGAVSIGYVDLIAAPPLNTSTSEKQ